MGQNDDNDLYDTLVTLPGGQGRPFLRIDSVFYLLENGYDFPRRSFPEKLCQCQPVLSVVHLFVLFGVPCKTCKMTRCVPFHEKITKSH